MDKPIEEIIEEKSVSQIRQEIDKPIFKDTGSPMSEEEFQKEMEEMKRIMNPIPEDERILEKGVRVARKTHICNRCNKNIAPGEKYQHVKAIWEDEFGTEKTCLDCLQKEKVNDRKSCGR